MAGVQLQRSPAAAVSLFCICTAKIFSWHVDVRMLDGAPKTPWRLRDYDSSPELLQRPKRQRYSLPSSLQPPAQLPKVAAAAADQDADEDAELAAAHDTRAEPAAEPEQYANGRHGRDCDDDDE